MRKWCEVTAEKIRGSKDRLIYALGGVPSRVVEADMEAFRLQCLKFAEDLVDCELIKTGDECTSKVLSSDIAVVGDFVRVVDVDTGPHRIKVAPWVRNVFMAGVR